MDAEKLKALLLALLGLSDEATEEEIEAAVKKHAEAKTETKGKTVSLFGSAVPQLLQASFP